MGTERSKRAEIVKRALQNLNDGNYDEENGYIVFGASSVWDMIMDLTDPPSERKGHVVEDRVGKLVSDSIIHDGRVHATRRTSLAHRPEFKTNALDNLLPQEQRALHDLLEKALQQKSAGCGQPRPLSESEVADALDAAFAAEVLGKLPEIVSRAAHLDEMNLEGVPDSVRRYFDEAHRCYLYGFDVACAVLCRAILESALKASVDPKGLIERKVPKERYFNELVENAKQLQDPHDGRDDQPCAFDVKHAGNWAIHNLSRFNREYGGERLHEVLANTRKVLLDLYTGKKPL
jgi:hypothetical protein